MTKQSRRSSLVQASDSHSHSHSHSHAHSLFHRLRHGALSSQDTPETQPGKLSKTDEPDSASRGEIELDSADDDHDYDDHDDDHHDDDSLTKRHFLSTAEKAADTIGDIQDSFVNRVIEHVSLIQYVDPWGVPLKTEPEPEPEPVDATPNNADSNSPPGINAAIPAHGTPLSAAPPGPKAEGGLRASSSSSSTVHSSENAKATPTASSSSRTTHTSVNAKVTPAASPHTTNSAFPNVGDIRNATASILLHANSSSITPTDTHSSSIHSSTSYSGPVLLSTSDLQSAKTTSSQSHTTEPVTTPSSSTNTNTKKFQTSSTSHQSSCSTPSTAAHHHGHFTLTVAGSLPSSPPQGTFSGNDDSNGGGGSVQLTPQQKQVIGGVVGSIAGIAVFGLLLMWFLRYKKRKGAGFLLDSQSGTTASRSLGGFNSGGGSAAAMTESSAASGAVASALAALTGKKTSPDPSPTAADERGFYRVAGRKLPSVLQTGGDGYSDPRASAASGNSDYYRGSQAFEPASHGSGQLALGAPMRPVSGFPVMRSGPARVAVTESPFIDPQPPITPTTLSPRSLPSRDSLRGSGSRFHESL
ncbi:hypothetical protein E4U55_006419 [Claviceps digitariae]|nr:hypothetical protein E4U55_006419 [Claviceps digitariae]